MQGEEFLTWGDSDKGKGKKVLITREEKESVDYKWRYEVRISKILRITLTQHIKKMTPRFGV